MDWKNYEELTKYIYESLGKQTGVKVEGYGSSCKVKGKSGVEHQIDILTSHTDGVHSYRTGIECKYWEKRVNKDMVMKVAEIIEDARINKGVIVSKRGFTEDAFSFAAHKNIGLVELREIKEVEREGGRVIPDIPIGTINIKSNIRRPKILTIGFATIDPNFTSKRINPYQYKVRLSNKKEAPLDKYIMSFKEELHRENPDKIVEKHYELKGATLINHASQEVTEISGLKLTGKLTIINLDKNLDIVDEVWMIMKTLFEGKSYFISRSGAISTGDDTQL
jgi:hypothetical protein